MNSRRADLSGHIILIVEDQPMLAFNLQVALEEVGAEVVVARGPQEAFARLRHLVFSAAVVHPRQRALTRELHERGVLVVPRPASRSELMARLATSIH
jgi:ActR/RegA family two-component response regulator